MLNIGLRELFVVVKACDSTLSSDNYALQFFRVVACHELYDARFWKLDPTGKASISASLPVVAEGAP